MENTVIIIPSLNPDEKLCGTVDGMIEAGFRHILLVDDGSASEYKKFFERSLSEHPECSLIVHDVNKGKGRALRDAFAYVAENMPFASGVITVDGDGQHKASDAVRLSEKMAEKPGCVWLGCRDFSKSNVPTHNMLGNRISSFVYKAVYGIRLSDTQTGLRAIPAEYMKSFAEDIEGERYEYETNMLIHIKDCGIPYGEIPIETVYIDDNSSSHFRVVRDSYRIYKPIILFVLGSCLATIVDLAVFTLLNAATYSGLPGIGTALADFAAWLASAFSVGLTAALLFVPTAAARIISSLVDYNFSRTKVFKNRDGAGSTLWKYYVVCVIRMLLSWLGVSLFANILGIDGLLLTLIKVAVDLILFFLSYRIQRTWVFRKRSVGK